jgi:hypothetical protein
LRRTSQGDAGVRYQMTDMGSTREEPNLYLMKEMDE